jgi:hypothetical protein
MFYKFPYLRLADELSLKFIHGFINYLVGKNLWMICNEKLDANGGGIVV